MQFEKIVSRNRLAGGQISIKVDVALVAEEIPLNDTYGVSVTPVHDKIVVIQEMKNGDTFAATPEMVLSGDEFVKYVEGLTALAVKLNLMPPKTTTTRPYNRKKKKSTVSPDPFPSDAELNTPVIATPVEAVATVDTIPDQDDDPFINPMTL